MFFVRIFSQVFLFIIRFEEERGLLSRYVVQTVLKVQILFIYRHLIEFLYSFEPIFGGRFRVSSEAIREKFDICFDLVAPSNFSFQSLNR